MHPPDSTGSIDTVTNRAMKETSPKENLLLRSRTLSGPCVTVSRCSGDLVRVTNAKGENVLPRPRHNKASRTSVITKGPGSRCENNYYETSFGDYVCQDTIFFSVVVILPIDFRIFSLFAWRIWRISFARQFLYNAPTNIRHELFYDEQICLSDIFIRAFFFLSSSFSFFPVSLFAPAAFVEKVTEAGGGFSVRSSLAGIICEINYDAEWESRRLGNNSCPAMKFIGAAKVCLSRPLGWDTCLYATAGF